MVVGADAHKRTHPLVVIDDAGRKLAEKTAAATPAPRSLPRVVAAVARAAVRPGRLPVSALVL